MEKSHFRWTTFRGAGQVLPVEKTSYNVYCYRPTIHLPAEWNEVGFFLNMIFFTSGQNSTKALPPIRPVIPQTQRSAAFPESFSLSTRHRLDTKLFPTFPAYRA